MQKHKEQKRQKKNFNHQKQENELQTDKKQRQHYGLLTATTMIIGIVIGSGIFFKCDDILLYTGGSIGLGILVFCIGAFSIIFGSLTLIELSIRTKKNGGIVGYYEDFISKKAASGFGWFQTFVYLPTINAVVSWVAAIYTFSFFGVKATLEEQIFLGFVFITFFYLLNILSYSLGGYFQNITTIIKLIPLIVIAMVGIFWKGLNPEIPAGIEIIRKSNVGFKWLAALTPIAFSFDGWTIATNITNEVKNPKKNMPRALIIGPLIILSVYLLYFLGMNTMLGPEYIMTIGNDAVNKAGELLLGNYGTRIILVFVIIAILGVVNGITLGSIRMPQALASKNMLPNAEKIAKLEPRYELSIHSCIIAYLVSLFWMLIHYITQKSGILNGGDVSEIAIVFSYVCYVILYIKVMQMRKENIIESSFKGILCPILAMLGSAIILIGGVISNPFYVILFLIICSFVCGIGYNFYKDMNKVV